MFIEKEKKILKRWVKNKDIPLWKQQENDLRKDKVRLISFYIPKTTFNKLKESDTSYDFSQYNIREEEKKQYVRLSTFVKTKKLTKVNEAAYLMYKHYHAYMFSDYITSNKNCMIKGKLILERLIQEHERK